MKENTRTLYVFILIAVIGFSMVRMKNSGLSQSGSSSEITENEIMDHIRFLSHDDRAGRYPGTRESKDAISYIIRNLRSYGVRPGGENKKWHP